MINQLKIFCVAFLSFLSFVYLQLGEDSDTTTRCWFIFRWTSYSTNIILEIIVHRLKSIDLKLISRCWILYDTIVYFTFVKEGIALVFDRFSLYLPCLCKNNINLTIIIYSIKLMLNTYIVIYKCFILLPKLILIL